MLPPLFRHIIFRSLCNLYTIYLRTYIYKGTFKYRYENEGNYIIYYYRYSLHV